MTHADEQRDKLNQAIAETTSLRGNYTEDIREFTRNRKLPMDTLIKLLLTMTGGTLSRELFDAGIDIAASSFVERRKQVSYMCLHRLLIKYNALCDDPSMLKGYRLWAIDGSTIPLPRDPSSKNHYKSDANPKGWNNTHANLLFDVLNEVFVDCYMGEGYEDSRKAHDEQGALYSLIYRRKFYKPTILVCDRGYESYVCLNHLLQITNLFFVMRVKNDGLRPVRELPEMEEFDKNLEWVVSLRQTKFSREQGDIFIPTGSLKGKKNSPKTRITRWDFGCIDGQYRFPMKCRAVRFMLDSGQYETLLTNLPQDDFSMADLKELYHMRWQIETNIRFWKYAVGALALHSRTDALISQELYAHLTIFNFCQRICREIEIPQKPGNKYEYQIDRTMAIYLCKKFFREPEFTGEKLIQDIKRYTVPIRPNRADERNLKAKSFPGFPYRTPS